MPILSSPTNAEWIYVYFPLAVMLLAAFFVERATGKIPNKLVAFVFAALGAARMGVGPGQPLLYLLSALIAGVPLIVCFAKGYMGGGTTKLAIAASLAFLPLPAMLLVLGLFASPWLVRPAFPDDDTPVSGSGILLAICVLTVAALALFGRPPIG